MKKSELAKAIKSVLAEGMPNLKKPTKFETQNDTPEMARVRKKLHAIQDRQDKFDKDKKDGKWTTEKGRPIQSKITDDKQAIFAELNKLAKEAKDKKKEKLDESKIRQAIREVLSEKQDIKEEAYDTVRDVKSALGNNPTQEDVEEYLGRSLDSGEIDAFGFQIAVGRRNGQPIYASQKPRRYPTYTRRKGGY